VWTGESTRTPLHLVDVTAAVNPCQRRITVIVGNAQREFAERPLSTATADAHSFPSIVRSVSISAVRWTTIELLVSHGAISGYQDRLPVLVAGKIVVSDEELVNAGLSAIPGEGDTHAPILRLSLGRVVRCNGVRLPETLN